MGVWCEMDAMELISNAFDGQDMKPRLDEMCEALETGGLSVQDVLYVVRASEDEELASMALRKLSEYLDEPRHSRTILDFMLECRRVGCETDFINDKIAGLVDSVENEMGWGDKKKAIWDLQSLWDAGVEIPRDRFNNMLRTYVVYCNDPNGNRIYELALNILVDINARAGDAGPIVSAFNMIADPMLKELAFRKVDIEMLEPLREEIVQYVSARIMAPVGGPALIMQAYGGPNVGIGPPNKFPLRGIAPAAILLERMAEKGWDVSKGLEAVSRYMDGVPFFEKTYPNLAYQTHMHRQGIAVDDEFRKSFRGPKCMMEKRSPGRLLKR